MLDRGVLIVERMPGMKPCLRVAAVLGLILLLASSVIGCATGMYLPVDDEGGADVRTSGGSIPDGYPPADLSTESEEEEDDGDSG
ncbi:MAG: hypothetical protein GF320_07510 [Armatimonadia bacterium]|nr:hypothetical protein [Armatimonadia bacterium]